MDIASGIYAVKQAVSGDSFIIWQKSNAGLPKEHTVCLSGVSAPRYQVHRGVEEPFAFEAREFLRQFVGKNVMIKVLVEGKNYVDASVQYAVDGEAQIANMVVKAGWATVRSKEFAFLI